MHHTNNVMSEWQRNPVYPIEETHSKGWAGPLATIAVVVFLGLVGLFIMLWVSTENTKTASTALLIILAGLLIVGLCVGMWALGARLTHHNARDLVAAMAQQQRANSPVLIGDYKDMGTKELPESAQWIVNGNTMHREERIERDAQQVYLQLKPQNIPPTRANIQKITGDSSHERASTIVGWLAERGYCTDGKQGKAPLWL